MCGYGFDKEAASDSLALTDILAIAANLKAMHVKTGKYAPHMALDTAFNDLGGALDTFLECIQGYNIAKRGHRLPVEDSPVSFRLPADDGLLSACKGLLKRFEDAASGLTKGQSALESVRDDVLNCFYQLFYRLDLK